MKKAEHFGKYMLLERIASGGMAEIFLGRAPGAGDIHKFIAIKRILPQFSDSQEYKNMFTSEAKIAVNLSHANIVSIYEFGIEKNQFFLVMDYVEGRNLRQVLNKMKDDSKRFSIEQIVYIIKEVAAGLDHAHRCINGSTGEPLNIIHRDMSPQNIMLSFEGEIKIVDFGIAKAETQYETTTDGTLKGKFGYMSPEQAEGQTVNLRTDIFSLGIILWELIANERLFLANNEINTLKKIRRCQIPSLRRMNPNIHPELERIVKKTLAKDQNLRYPHSAALHRDLNRFLNRRYPDFSPQDLSEFIKKIYASEILSARKRLIEYAKIPLSPPKTTEDKTIVIASNQGLKVDTETLKENLNFESGLIDSNVFTNANSSLTLTDAEEEKPLKIDHETVNKKLALTREIFDSNSYSQSYSSNTNIRRPGHHVTRNHTNFDVKIRKERRVGGLIAFLITVLVFAGLVYQTDIHELFTPRKMSEIISDTREKVDLTSQIPSNAPVNQYSPPTTETAPPPPPSTSTSPSLSSPNPPPVVSQPKAPPPDIPDQLITSLSDKPKTKQDFQPPPVEELVTISIRSKPSNARIFFNGKDIGERTPAIINVSRDRPVTIELKKDKFKGHIEKHTSFRSGQKISATLQRASIAYLNIDVKPPSRNLRVYLNGKRIKYDVFRPERLPVPAGRTLNLEVVDPSKHTSATAKILLKENQRKSVLFHLRPRNRSQRLPSQEP